MQRPKGRIGKKKKRSNMKMHVLKWLSHAEFHGANRLADSEASWFWIPSMFLLMIVANIVIYLTIMRYLDNPTYMQQTETSHTVLRFPSVIIYPGVSFRKFKKLGFLSRIKYPQGLNKSYVWKVLPQLAAFFSPDVRYNINDLQNLELLLQHNNLDLETAGRQLTETCEEILIRCRWKNEYQNCSDLFRMEMNRDGFACVFNGRSLRREMQEQIHILQRTPVQYTSRFGFSSGLMIAVNQSQRPLDVNLYYKWCVVECELRAAIEKHLTEKSITLSNVAIEPKDLKMTRNRGNLNVLYYENINGIPVALQGGQDFVDHSINGTPLNPGTEQWVAYYVQSVQISDVARGLNADLKRCGLYAERQKYFPIYGREYCLLECEIAATIKQCHCVLIGHPRPNGIPYCTARRFLCAKRISVDADTCRCLPTCDVEKTVMKSSSFILNPNSGVLDSFYKGLQYEKVTIVRVFVQQRLRKSNQRMSFMSYLDLFSQLGGMVNIFFGCSVLTLLGLIQLLWKIISMWWSRLKNKLLRTRVNNAT